MTTASESFHSKYDPSYNEKRKDAFIALYYVLILVMIGIPMWFFTTSTYRATLPSDKIENFSKSKISVAIKLNIICFEPIVELDELVLFEDKLFHNLREKYSYNTTSVPFKYYGYVRPASTKEWQAHRSGKSMREIESLAALDGSDGIYFLILPRDTILLKTNQNGFIRSKSDKNVIYLKMANFEKLRILIETLVVNFLSPNTYLNNVYKAVSEIPTKENFDKISPKIRTLFTRVRTSSTYDWTFSLVVPNPLGGSEPEWNFARLQRLYLEPMQRKLAKYIHVRISSQVIYGVRLESLWSSKKFSNNERVYSKEDLTHVVNGLETYLGSSDNTHFVTYLASAISQPSLHLEQSRGVRSKLDAFTVPRWGGLVLLNNVTVPIEGDDIMMKFLPQIRSLMGLAKSHLDAGLPVEDPDQSGLAVWQVQSWLRERTVENIAIVQVTLHSVLDLLDKVANMVIRDDVAQSIDTSVQLAHSALQLLTSNTDHDGLTGAFLASKQALKAAEAAFFHPSLLELLYFQEDQKYGIYIPFFVPILLPLFHAALKVRPFLGALIRKTKAD